MAAIRVLTNDDGRGLWEHFRDAVGYVADGGALFVRDESTDEMFAALSPMGWFRLEVEE